ncbi:AbrB/MazE/SpoVT family DNA-binding domain-containing protein [Candidatus Bathyarchaeota archaeon]|nr:AbrB/MazE/SpoVT family DNA-binding domain-containing protein [Candidatus Bathyarchaeota archaeon]
MDSEKILNIKGRRVLASSVITRNYQITMPRRVRALFRFEEGDLVLFVVEDGKLIIEKG